MDDTCISHTALYMAGLHVVATVIAFACALYSAFKLGASHTIAAIIYLLAYLAIPISTQYATFFVFLSILMILWIFLAYINEENYEKCYPKNQKIITSILMIAGVVLMLLLAPFVD